MPRKAQKLASESEKAEICTRIARVTWKNTDVIEGDSDAVKEKVQAAIAACLPAVSILNKGMIVAMTEVGKLFEDGENFVKIGADGFVADASHAVPVAKSLVSI